MIRIIVQLSEIGAAANIGGPVQVNYKTFDVELPEVEALLREKSEWTLPCVIGVELLESKK